MKRILIALCLCVSVLLTVAWSQQPKPTTWEYKVIVGKCWDEKKINPLGAEGWELTTYSTWGAGMSSVDTCVFKRPKL